MHTVKAKGGQGGKKDHFVRQNEITWPSQSIPPPGQCDLFSIFYRLKYFLPFFSERLLFSDTKATYQKVLLFTGEIVNWPFESWHNFSLVRLQVSNVANTNTWYIHIICVRLTWHLSRLYKQWTL